MEEFLWIKLSFIQIFTVSVPFFINYIETCWETCLLKFNESKTCWETCLLKFNESISCDINIHVQVIQAIIHYQTNKLYAVNSTMYSNSGVDLQPWGTGWLGIRIMCPSGATCLSADCCFS
jgi:hypothetical protein